jgi:flagellar hook-length control protein FliK
MIAPQKQETQEKSKKNAEETLATVDPSLMAQALPAYQNAPLENRRPIDVDRNKQPSFTSLSDTLPAEKPLLPSQSNLDSKSPGADNPRASLAQSIETTMANADAANLAAPSTSNGNSAPPAFASLMANHAQNAGQPPMATSSPAIATALQDSRWPQEFSDRIVWIAKSDQQQAQINITPAQLGPVQITVNLNGDQASINFASPHAEVRKAIEDAMPNLREMLASSGINLGQSNVGAQLQQQQRDLPGQFANGTRAAGENAILPADSRSGSISSSLPIQRGRGLVDLFA